MKSKHFRRILHSSWMAAAIFSVAMVSIQPAGAQSIRPITVKSSMSFDGTVNAIKQAVSKGGMMVMSELNQGKMLSMTGLSLQAESLFIGNPQVGKQAFSDDPSVGVVIPVRLNIYEKNGSTYISYFKPSDLFSSFSGRPEKMLGQKLDMKLHMMTSMLSN